MLRIHILPRNAASAGASGCARKSAKPGSKNHSFIKIREYSFLQLQGRDEPAVSSLFHTDIFIIEKDNLK